MSEKQNSKYVVRQDLKGVSTPRHNAPFQLVGTKSLTRSRRITWGFIATVWAVLGPYAYYVWLYKKPKKQSDEEHMPVEAPVSTPDDSKRKDLGLENFENFVSQRLGKTIEVTAENFADVCPTNNSMVVMNKEKERFEITYQLFEHAKAMKVLSYEQVEKDEEGNFVYDENGIPVEKLTKFKKFLYDDFQRLFQVIDFMKSGVSRFF